MMKFSRILPSIQRFWLPLVLTCTTLLTVVACNPANFQSQAAKVPQLVESILSDPKTFNYALSQESPNIFGLTFEGLVSENPLNGKIEPALAESWKVSDDKLTIVFTLRPNLKWSDGQPLTVDDVVFTYNDIYFNEKIPTDARDSLRVGQSRKLPQVKKAGDRQVAFITPEPFVPLLRTTGLPILPAHALRESVTKKDSEGKPQFLTKWSVDTPPEQLITNGAYKLERYDTSQRVVFRRNPYYWRKGEKGEAQPYIERIIWEIVESTDTSLLQFRSGSLDSVGITPEYFSLLKLEEKRGNFQIYNGGPSPGRLFMFFNLNKGKRDGKPLVDPIKSRWFTNVDFRRAVAYGIDRQKMINNTYRGLGVLQNSPIADQSPYNLSPEEGLKVYKYNLEKAKQLLIKAGFKYNEKGELFDGDGNRVRFTLLTNAGNKIREAIGAQIKQDLSQIGIQVDFTPLAWSAYTDKLSNSLDWDAGIIGFGAGVEPNDSANLWTTDGGLHMFNQKPQAGQKPLQGREIYDWEKEIEQLYIRGAQEFDEVKRKEIYDETQRITQEYLPFIYLVNPYSLVAVRNRFQGIQYTALGGAFWNIYEIKVTEN
jgi:peptide/nickel transport system substrate-binding protein